MPSTMKRWNGTDWIEVADFDSIGASAEAQIEQFPFPASQALAAGAINGLAIGSSPTGDDLMEARSILRPSGWTGPSPLPVLIFKEPGFYTVQGNITIATTVAGETGTTYLHMCKGDGSALDVGQIKGTDAQGAYGPLFFNTYGQFKSTFQITTTEVAMCPAVYVPSAFTTWTSQGNLTIIKHPAGGGGSGGTGGTGAPEVYIGSEPPVDPNITLWYDTDAEAATSYSNEVLHWNTAWGTVSEATKVTDVVVSVNNTLVLGTTFVAVAGRRYRASFRGSGQYAVTGSVVHNVLTLDNVSVGEQRYTTGAINEQILHTVEALSLAPAAGSHTVELRGNFTGAGGVQYNGTWHPMRLVVEDAGPITAVTSIAPPGGQLSVVAAGNALGVVAIGACKTNPVNLASAVAGDMTEVLNFVPLSGRRYRVVYACRAIAGGASVPAALRVMLANAGVQEGSDRWTSASTNYSNTSVSWIVNGDSAPRTWKVVADSGTVATTSYPSEFYVEDVGPLSTPALPIGVTDPPWSALSLVNSWANAGGGYKPASYRRVGDLLHMQGMIAGGATPSTFATLPVGFRPAFRQEVTAYQYAASAVIATCQIAVYTDGHMTLNNAANIGTASLAQIIFLT